MWIKRPFPKFRCILSVSLLTSAYTWDYCKGILFTAIKVCIFKDKLFAAIYFAIVASPGLGEASSVTLCSIGHRLLNLYGQIFIEGWESRSAGMCAGSLHAWGHDPAQGPPFFQVPSEEPPTCIYMWVNPQLAAPGFKLMTFRSRALCHNHSAMRAS